MIFADGTADPSWVAADLCAQAEHTGDNTVILVSDSQIGAVKMRFPYSSLAFEEGLIRAGPLRKTHSR